MHDEHTNLDSEWPHSETDEHLGDSSGLHSLEGPSDITFEPDGQPAYGPEPGADTIGHPEANASDWQSQGTQDGMCGPTSIAMVVNGLGLDPGGEPLTGADVAQWAISHGDMTSDGRPLSSSDLGYEMNANQIAAVLDHYGVHNEEVQGGSLQSLESYLADGHEVILGVDGDRIWHDLPAGQDAGQPNHALVVTGIDPHTGYAYLNDPGTTDGRMEAVPISTLMSAWSTSDYTAIVTDGTQGDHAPAPVEPATHTSTQPGGSGYVILPATLPHEELVLKDDLISVEESIEHNPEVVKLEGDLSQAAQTLHQEIADATEQSGS
ncbi:MAG: C39 family peptidase [Solirubrobacteraceae bacterium]